VPLVRRTISSHFPNVSIVPLYGHDALRARVLAAIQRGALPASLLLHGPRGIGKQRLALWMAQALVCSSPANNGSSCGRCQSCRFATSLAHPDVHWFFPRPRLESGATIRDVANDFALAISERASASGLWGPSSGLEGIYVATVRAIVQMASVSPAMSTRKVFIIGDAEQMVSQEGSDEAANALLKLLEEPPAGVTIILCADDEDRLLPTVHSRVARVRLGTLAAREIESLLEERGEADAPTANRLARLAGGRPGLAVAYARAPEAATIRGEVTRSLLDLSAASRALRLVRVRELLARARELRAALAATEVIATEETGRPRRRGRGAPPPVVATPMPDATAGSDGEVSTTSDGEAGAGPPAESAAPARTSAADRRADAALLLELWRDLALDLARAGFGDVASVRDPDLIEELMAVAERMPERAVGSFLVRLDSAGQALDTNVSPELVGDVLALAWPRVSDRASA